MRYYFNILYIIYLKHLSKKKACNFLTFQNNQMRFSLNEQMHSEPLNLNLYT
jgi:hypothetical protein